MGSEVGVEGGEGELLVAGDAAVAGAGGSGNQGQLGRPPRPVMTPEISHQILMDLELPQLAPAQVGPAGRSAVATAAAAGAMAHSYIPDGG
jgi:hypothetical protein